MTRSGVLGPRDATALAPWLRLPATSAIDVLFVVVSTDVTVERYRFQARTVAGVPSMALVDVALHSEAVPDGEAVTHDAKRLYWPPVDVVKAAEAEARRRSR